MGKDKNAPRAKRNQKPSSSVRSAELLGGVSNNSTGFLGFGVSSNYCPTTTSSDNSISQDFRLAMRKMAKKDSKTKIKALQEFEELIKSEELVSIETTLPFWPRLYTKLSMDIEKKVRESTQVSHGSLASKVGRLLGPHLPLLVPTWLLAMCDTYPAAAATAKRAFQSVFSEDKRPDVMFRYSKEIMDFTSDNLFRQTADTLSDPNSSTPEEREEKYIRVLCSSLASVSMLQRLTQDHASYSELLLPILTELLAMEAFWKMHKHPHPKVRTAFFDCVSVVVGSGGCSVLTASLAIRAGLGDTDASVLPRAYTALLHLAAKHKTCWDELGHSGTKPVPDRLLRFVAEQCRGVAADVLPLLLPLISVIPHSALGQHDVYYTRLLQALADNVLKSDSMPSRHEVNAMHQTFFECVRFLSNDSTLDSSFWETVLVNMVGPMLLESLKTARQLESGAVYEAVITLSRYWARRLLRDTGASQSKESPSPATEEGLTAGTSQDATPAEDLSATQGCQAIPAQHTRQLIAMLWQVCFAQCEMALKSEAGAGAVEKQLSIFLDTINNPHLHSQSKLSGVKFSPVNSRRCSLDGQNSSRSSSRDSSPTASRKTVPFTPQPGLELSSSVSLTKAGLARSPPAYAAEDMFRVQFGGSVSAVSELARACHLLYLAEEGGTPVRLQLLKLLVQLLSMFTELQPYRTLLSDDLFEKQTCYVFLQSILLPELRGSHYNEQCLLVQLLDKLLPQLSRDEQEQILALMQDECSVESLRAVLEQNTKQPQQCASVVAWLASPALGTRLVKLLREAFAITEALAYERQDIASEQRRKPKASLKTDPEEGEAVEEEEEEDVLRAQQQREHLVTVLRLMLAPTQGFRLNSSTVRQVASVLVTAVPSSLHKEQHRDSASSACSNIELVLQLSSAVFSSSACWQLSESTDLLLTLFGLLCPADLLLGTSPDINSTDQQADPEEDSILPSEVAEQLKHVVYRALRSLVAAARKEFTVDGDLVSSSTATNSSLLIDQELSSGTQQVTKDVEATIENIQCQLNSCLKQLFGRVTTLLYDPCCTYSAAIRLADISGDCLMVLSEETALQEEWDIPLDQQAVRDAFNMLVPSEGLLSEWESAMSTVYLAPTVMLGGSCFRNAALPRDTQASVSQCEGYTRVAVFLSAVLVRLCGLKPSQAAADECSEQCDAECVVHGPSEGSAAQVSVERLLLLLEDNNTGVSHHREQPEHGQVSLGPYCRLACVCVHAHHYLSSAVQLSAALNTGISRPALHTAAGTLEHNTAVLLRHMNAGNLQQLSQVVRNMAAESQTGLWCVTLQRLLQEHRGHINVSKLMHGLSSEAYNSTAVKQVLVRFLPPAEVSTCLKGEVARLCLLTDDPFSGADVAAVVSCLLHRCTPDDASSAVPAVMNTLLDWWRQADALFLFAEDVSVRGSRAEDLSVVVSVVRVVTVVVTRHSHLLSPHQWERLLCAVTAWVQSLQDSQQSVERDAVLGALVCAVARCVAAIETLMQRLSDAPQSERSLYPEKLVEEWQEFFSNFLHSVMLPLFFRATGWYCAVSSRSVWLYCLCRALAQYAAVVPARELCQHALPPLHHPEDDDRPQNLPSNMQVLLNHLVGGLLSPQPGVAGTCHLLLQRALPAIMERWCSSAAVASTDAAEETVQVGLPYVLIRAIEECGSVVAAVLDERPALGGWCVVLPHTDSHTFVLGYCLAWHSIFSALKLCDEAKRQDYASELKSPCLLPRLLTMLTKLLPPEHSFPPRVDCDTKHKSGTFLDTPLERLLPNECGSSYVIWWLACQLYYQSMTLLPYWVRIWYNSLSKQKADAISTYTQRYFSPMVIAEEIEAIKDYKCPDNTVTVRVRSQREVLASYIIDESELVLTLQLPSNMPLAPAEMVHSDHAGVSPKLWEGWKSGMKTVLTYRNSPLLASLKVWKQNLDQKYQGVEPCYICYCIMQPVNHTLPTSLCRTCKKKFHSSCLYQWFLTSPTSTCPLCRSVW